MAPGRIFLSHQNHSVMNWKIIAWYTGVSLLLVAALMTVSGIIALFTPGDESRMPLLFSALLTGTVGAYPLFFVRKGGHKMSFREGNSIVVGAWLLACLFGMLPFLFYGREFTPINAIFESISGFTTTGASILNDIEVLTVAMLAAGIHFGILFLAFLRGRPKYIWKSETVKVFVALVLLAIVVVTVDLMASGSYTSLGSAIRDASFQVASISTTTGFATQDTTLWPPLSMSVLIVCSLICGCSGSTSGGIKIDRAILAAKGIHRKVKLTVSPNGIFFVRVDGRIRSDDQVMDAYGYIFCYLLIVVIFAAVNITFGLDFTTGVTASIACLGNVGPGFGAVGSMSNYAAFPTVLKASGMIEMLVGRLEIFPILYLLRSVKNA